MMENIEKAKQIYTDILSAIDTIEFDCDVFCAIPPFIEFDGNIYQHYQCLSEEEYLKQGKRYARQMAEVVEGKVKFYHSEEKNDA